MSLIQNLKQTIKLYSEKAKFFVKSFGDQFVITDLHVVGRIESASFDTILISMGSYGPNGWEIKTQVRLNIDQVTPISKEEAIEHLKKMGLKKAQSKRKKAVKA